jgi:hypothetical protein
MHCPWIANNQPLGHAGFASAPSAIQNDFYDLRDAGHPHPLMNEIERRMFEPDDTDEHSVDGIEPLVETMKQVIELDQTRVTPRTFYRY